MIGDTAYKIVNKGDTIVENLWEQLRKIGRSHTGKKVMDPRTLIRIIQKAVLTIIKSLTLYES
jgi:hypothetical protein